MASNRFFRMRVGVHPPTSATQTAAARAHSQSCFREAPNQRAALRPARGARGQAERPAQAHAHCGRWCGTAGAGSGVTGGGDRGVPERATLQVRGRARGWDGMGWDGMGWDGLGWAEAAPDLGLLQERRSRGEAWSEALEKA